MLMKRFLTNLLACLKGRGNPRSFSRGRRPAPRRPALRVEHLEERAVPAGSILGFSAASYSASEGNGTAGVLIEVSRSGDLSGTSSVRYATSDFTATAPAD